MVKQESEAPVAPQDSGAAAILSPPPSEPSSGAEPAPPDLAAPQDPAPPADPPPASEPVRSYPATQAQLQRARERRQREQQAREREWREWEAKKRETEEAARYGGPVAQGRIAEGIQMALREGRITQDQALEELRRAYVSVAPPEALPESERQAYEQRRYLRELEQKVQRLEQDIEQKRTREGVDQYRASLRDVAVRSAPQDAPTVRRVAARAPERVAEDAFREATAYAQAHRGRLDPYELEQALRPEAVLRRLEAQYRREAEIWGAAAPAAPAAATSRAATPTTRQESGHDAKANQVPPAREVPPRRPDSAKERREFYAAILRGEAKPDV